MKNTEPTTWPEDKSFAQLYLNKVKDFKSKNKGWPDLLVVGETGKVKLFEDLPGLPQTLKSFLGSKIVFVPRELEGFIQLHSRKDFFDPQDNSENLDRILEDILDIYDMINNPRDYYFGEGQNDLLYNVKSLVCQIIINNERSTEENR